MAFIAEPVSFTLPTSINNAFDVPLTKFSASELPKAAIFVGAWPLTGRASCSNCYGMATADTAQACNAWGVLDAASTSRTHTRYSELFVFIRVNDQNNRFEEVRFSSFASDGSKFTLNVQTANISPSSLVALVLGGSDFNAEVLLPAMSTSPGLQSISSSTNTWTPTGAIVLCNNRITGANTSRVTHIMGLHVLDGTDERSHTSVERTARSPSAVWQRNRSGDAASTYTDFGGVQDGRATFVSFDDTPNSGLTIDWVDAPPGAYKMPVLLFGGVNCKAGQILTGTSTATPVRISTDVGFAPSGALAVAVGTGWADADGYRTSIGFGDGTIDNSVAYFSQDNVSTTVAGNFNSGTDSIFELDIDGTILEQGTIEFVGNNLDIVLSTADVSSNAVMYLALGASGVVPPSIEATVEAQAITAGDFDIQRPVDATITAQAITAGDFDIQRPVDATITAQAITAGDFDIRRPVDATLEAIAATLGDFSIIGLASIASTIISTADTAGDLTILAALNATIEGQGQTSGNLIVAHPLDATVTATAINLGSFVVTAPDAVAAMITGVATTSGSLVVTPPVGIDAIIEGVALTANDLSVLHPVATTINGVAGTFGNIPVGTFIPNPCRVCELITEPRSSTVLKSNPTCISTEC